MKDRPTPEPKEKKCACCGSTDLEHIDSSLAHETIVCLDCGYTWSE